MEFTQVKYTITFTKRCMGKPVLVALIAGKSAHTSEKEEKETIKDRLMKVLRKVLQVF